MHVFTFFSGTCPEVPESQALLSLPQANLFNNRIRLAVPCALAPTTTAWFLLTQKSGVACGSLSQPPKDVSIMTGKVPSFEEVTSEAPTAPTQEPPPSPDPPSFEEVTSEAPTTPIQEPPPSPNSPSSEGVTAEAPTAPIQEPPASPNLPSFEEITFEASTAPIQEAPPSPNSPNSPDAGSQGPSRTPSPILVRPASPTSSAEDAPPSPALSAFSVHFRTTTDLHGRNPGDGLSSLQTVQLHARKNAAASFQTVIEPDHPSHPVLPSSATSFISAITAKNSVYKGDGNDALPTCVHINPNDDHTDPTPFAFEPYALAALVDPKTLKGLENIGGLEGLCTGLGTSPTKGLSAHSLGQGASFNGETSGGEGPFAAPLSDRQRVYGINTLPTRRSKSLVQYMWLALKDKVLVC